jgi:hypothetical protein
MTIPEQEGRPVWEPLIIALSLAALLAYDWTELVALVHGRAGLTVMARAALELGVAAMMAWGLLTSLYRAARWTPDQTDGV